MRDAGLDLRKSAPVGQLRLLLPSNLSLFRCRECGTTFAYVPFTAPEADFPLYYHRRENPKFCPRCGRPL